jgi:hypothetical protein
VYLLETQNKKNDGMKILVSCSARFLTPVMYNSQREGHKFETPKENSLVFPRVEIYLEQEHGDTGAGIVTTEKLNQH